MALDGTTEYYLRHYLDDFGVPPAEPGTGNGGSSSVPPLSYKQDNFVGDGSTKEFNLTFPPAQQYSYPWAYIGGTPQLQPTQVSFVGNELIFVTAPPIGAAITVFYYYLSSLNTGGSSNGGSGGSTGDGGSPNGGIPPPPGIPSPPS